MPSAIDGKGVSPGSEAQPHDCRLGEVRGDHASAFGGGAPVPSQGGVDVAFIERDTLTG